MSKKLLSVLLAVLVVAMALPIGFVLAEDPTYTITIVDEKMINGFPATGNSTVDPGMSAADGVKYYAYTETSNTVEYAEGVDGVKITGNGGFGDISFRLKDTSFEGANMLSFYMDATAANGEGDDHLLYIRPAFDYASSKFDVDTARYFASGHSYYFLEDGTTEAIKIDVAQNASVWDVSIKLFAGKKGTYFFPEECFADYGSEVTGNVAPNNVVLPAGAWTSFGDNHLVDPANDWVMNDANYGNANFVFQRLWIPSGDVIIIDDIKYVQATVTENEAADDEEEGPVTVPTLTVQNSVVVNDAPTAEGTLLDSPGVTSEGGLAHYGNGSNGIVASYDEASTGIKYTCETETNGRSAYYRIKGYSFDGANMISFWMDTTGVAADPEDEYINSKLLFNFGASKSGGADESRYLKGGSTYYFVEDGTGKVEKITVGTANSKDDVRASFKKNAKGTYYIPEECFQSTTADVSGYDHTYVAGSWTSFSQLVNPGSGYLSWVMGNLSNGGQVYVAWQYLDIAANESIIIDNLSFVKATYSEPEVTGPVENPNVPSVGSENETVEGANDGKITGVDATMEYRAEADADYTAITGDEITGLAPGKYYVRYAATAEFLASADAEVVIAAGAPAGGGEGGGEEPVEAPTYNREVAGENFDEFVPNMNWDPVWGHNFSIYSNNPGDAVTQYQVAITNGRFTITPGGTAADGMRFTTDIYNVGGNWDAKYEAFSFDLDTTGLADNLTLRMKFFGRNYVPFETERGDIVTVQFNVAANDIYYVAEDGTATKASFVSKEDEAVRDYQWDIPNGFKGTVIIPKNAIVPEVAGNSIDDEFTSLGFQFEFLNWRAADNGESVSIDNFKYLYNYVEKDLEWVGEGVTVDKTTVNFGDDITATFTVSDDAGSFLKAWVSYDQGEFTLSDDVHVTANAVAVDGTTTITVTFNANEFLEAGTHEVEFFVGVMDDDSFIGAPNDTTNTKIIEITVNAADLDDYTIELEKDSYTYDGTAKTPAVVIKDANGNVIDASEYVVSYEGNIEIGTALVVITDAEGGKYIVADGKKEFAITPVALGDLTIELGEVEYTYDGTAKEPTVVVKDADGNVVDEYEYVVTYTNNVNAGTATVTITDAEGGLYTVETTTAEFTIKAAANTNTPAANGQGETVEGKADGIITGVDSTMEYRAEGETTYTAITGTELKGLAPGKYYIRYAATENYAASAEFEVVIAVGQPAPEPDMGVHSYVLAALLLMIAAAGVGVISLKKRAIQ